ncbi:hypothetical protein [Salinicola tamaricis]|uniref:hypothetical protein n=1 Tax=Salinicola tamaricis TaxID=1771309 RepID=UPI0030F44E4D
MIGWLAEYAMFLAKTATLVVALALVLALVAHGRRRGGGDSGGKLRVTSLNARFSGRQRQLQLAATPKSGRRQLAKRFKREEKKASKAAVGERVWVLDFEGDLKASATPALSELVSLLITQLESGDEVVLRLTSGAGWSTATASRRHSSTACVTLARGSRYAWTRSRPAAVT